jgi:hypothetical protein
VKTSFGLSKAHCGNSIPGAQNYIFEALNFSIGSLIFQNGRWNLWKRNGETQEGKCLGQGGKTWLQIITDIPFGISKGKLKRRFLL